MWTVFGLSLANEIVVVVDLLAADSESFESSFVVRTFFVVLAVVSSDVLRLLLPFSVVDVVVVDVVFDEAEGRDSDRPKRCLNIVKPWSRMSISLKHSANRNTSNEHSLLSSF